MQYEQCFGVERHYLAIQSVELGSTKMEWRPEIDGAVCNSFDKLDIEQDYRTHGMFSSNLTIPFFINI